MEHQYFRYYQVPAALRSFGRLSILSVFMMTFGRLLEWVVGLRYPPCRIVPGGGCHWWCSLLWITTIVITGRTCGTFLATFMGGPLRLEMCNEAANNRNSNRRRVQPHRFFLTHISNIIHWMLDPDQVIREIVNSASADLKPFHPDGGLFPATWGWLLVLQTIACTREMSRNYRIMHSIMFQVLIQQALYDEWYRVLILERRVALGVVLISLYFVATIGVFWTVGTVDGLSALLTLPTVCAVMVSTWMNIFFYFERRDTRKRLAADSDSLYSLG
jgi:tryptophan-rich sensory protein